MRVLFAIVSALMAFTFSGCSINVGMRKSDKLKEVVVSQKDGEDKILLLGVDGMVSFESHGSFLQKEPGMVAQLREQLELARGDEQVKAVLVRINSTGGTLAATQMVYDEIQQFRKDTGKYVLALYLEVAASGALYLSMASDRIMAYPSALTGSLGVLFVSPNFQELGRKIGIEYRVVKSGPKKDMGTPFRNWPPEEQKMLEALAAGYNEQFKQAVFDNRKTRGMTQAEFEVLTDARIVSAEQALKLHLIDELGNMKSAIAHLEKKFNRGRMKVIAYTRYPDEVKTLYSRTYGVAAELRGPLASGRADQVVESVARAVLPAGAGQGLEKGFYYLW